MKSKNRHQTLLVFAVVVAALVLGGRMRGAGAQEEDQFPPGSEEYIEMGCYQCHGYDGNGGGGPRLAPDPLPFEAFSSVVRRPPNVMPAYSPNVLTDEKLRDIYEYLESIPDPPDASSVPALSEE